MASDRQQAVAIWAMAIVGKSVIRLVCLALQLLFPAFVMLRITLRFPGECLR